MFHLDAKAPTEVVERRWTVPVDADDSPLSAVVSASGVTLDADSIEGNELVLTLSGGTALATGAITATVTTNLGRVLVQTLYIPIVLSTRLKTETARDVCYYALRKVYGRYRTPPAAALTDALETLNDMLLEWKAQGADLHVPALLTDTAAMHIPDYAMSAVKANLMIRLANLYEMNVAGDVPARAVRGLQLIKNANISDTRAKPAYF